jgi:hypothetical protein
MGVLLGRVSGGRPVETRNHAYLDPVYGLARLAPPSVR